ncbi:MAG: hypothetical protein ACLU9S_14460 [Oscillospiraceae bacterium]
MSAGSCGASYHITAHPPKVEGVCDAVRRIAHRSAQDDAPETVKNRLKVYPCSRPSRSRTSIRQLGKLQAGRRESAHRVTQTERHSGGDWVRDMISS